MSAQQQKCGQEAVELLNCLAVHGTGKCDAQIEAFTACATKLRLQKFVLVEECSSTAQPQTIEAAKPKADETKTAECKH